MNSALTELKEISRFYGSKKNYVIAGGGNTSWKDEHHLYIKASGVALATITEQGFCILDRKKLDKIPTMSLSFGVARSVAVGHPVGGFPRIGGADAALGLHKLFAAVGLEVNTDQWLRGGLSCQVHKFSRAYLVGFHTAPAEIEHGRSLGAGPDAFAPAIKIRENTTPPEHGWGQVACRADQVRAPAVAQVIPRCLHRAVSGAEGLHELHKEKWRQLKPRLG